MDEGGEIWSAAALCRFGSGARLSVGPDLLISQQRGNTIEIMTTSRRPAALPLTWRQAGRLAIRRLREIQNRLESQSNNLAMDLDKELRAREPDRNHRLLFTKVETLEWGWSFWWGFADGGSILGGGPILVNRITGEVSEGAWANDEWHYKQQARKAGLRAWWKFW